MVAEEERQPLSKSHRSLPWGLALVVDVNVRLTAVPGIAARREWFPFMHSFTHLYTQTPRLQVRQHQKCARLRQLEYHMVAEDRFIADFVCGWKLPRRVVEFAVVRRDHHAIRRRQHRRPPTAVCVKRGNAHKKGRNDQVIRPALVSRRSVVIGFQRIAAPDHGKRFVGG